MFYHLHENKHFENWVVLGINPHILLGNRTIFCCFTNASKDSGSHIQPLGRETLEDLFYQEKIHPDGATKNRQKIPLHYTTDPQAELLIEGAIAPEYIMTIWYKNVCENSSIDLPSGHQILVQSDASLFDYRKDSWDWDHQ